MKKIKFNKNFKSGFTLIELLVVVAIIAIIVSVVLASLGTAKNRGAEAGVKSNLNNARSQAEVFYNTNTAVPNSYTGVCTNPGPVGDAKTVAAHLISAAKAGGVSGYNINGVPSAPGITMASCNDIGSAWAAEVPLRGGGMWCVDSNNKSLKETGTSFSNGADYTCI